MLNTSSIKKYKYANIIQCIYTVQDVFVFLAVFCKLESCDDVVESSLGCVG